jgi:hypothetical protein
MNRLKRLLYSSRLRRFLHSIFCQETLNLSGLVISLVALLVSMNALNVTRKMYVLTSRDYLPELQFETSEGNLRVINGTSDIFAIESMQFLKIEEITFAHMSPSDNYIVLLPLLTNSGMVFISDGHSREFHIDTTQLPGLGLADPGSPDSQSVYRQPWNGDIDFYPITQGLLRSIQLRAVSEGIDNTYVYLLVEIRYADQLHSIRSVNYRCSNSLIDGSFGAEMISEEEASRIVSSCIGRFRVPQTDDFTKLWDSLVQTHKTPG